MHNVLTIIFLHRIFKEPWCKMTQGIHGNNLFLVGPLREWTNISRRLRVGKIGSR